MKQTKGEWGGEVVNGKASQSRTATFFKRKVKMDGELITNEIVVDALVDLVQMLVSIGVGYVLGKSVGYKLGLKDGAKIIKNK